MVLRQRLLNEAEQRYTRAIQTRRGIETQIDQQVERLEQMNQQVLAARGLRFSASQQQAFFQAMDQARLEIRKMQENLKRAKQMESLERRKYIEANRNHEILVKLQDKQKEKHFQEQLLKEQQLQDDLFNARRAVMQAAKTS